MTRGDGLLRPSIILVAAGCVAIVVVTHAYNLVSLPARIEACDRTYLGSNSAGSNSPSVWTAAKATADGQAPLFLVVPGPFGRFTACPVSPGSIVPTLVFVKVRDDGYAPYRLSGGP